MHIRETTIRETTAVEVDISMTANSTAGKPLPAAEAVKPGDAGSEMTADGSDCTPSKSAEQSTSEPPSAVKQGYRPSDPSPASPQVHSQIYQQPYIPHLTPQPGAGYYLYGNPQVTPEPQSPAAQGYDMTSFLQQQAALGVHPGNPFGATGQYGGIPQAPLSPSRAGGLIPPPSPLFPRPTGTHMAGSFEHQGQLDSSVLRGIQGQTPQSPSGTFMSPALGPSNVPGFGGAYSGYPAATGVGNYATVLNGATQLADSSASPDDTGWGERNNMQYAQASNRVMPGLPGGYPGMSRAGSGNRSYSFDEMLPPSMLDQQDQTSAPYSPYSNAQIAPGNTQFVHQQSWGYGVSGDMYNPPQSPLQQRQSPHMQPHFPGAHAGMGPPPMLMGPYGGQQPMPPYYPATSPGPPIQTTASNKGPDGANLFIFHIPNHFTNLDMYRLFCQYGNLLSVRIMVEKDTGRSRGFGFVSYDSPESAALAIKELNGFAIGNKRLKVQHKQIRGDQHRNDSFGSPTHSGDPTFMPRPDVPPGVASSEDMGISSTPWYDAATKPSPPDGAVGEEDEDIHPDNTVVGDLNEGLVGNIAPLLPSIGTEQQVAQPVDNTPLASLEPLLNALPDVAGHVGTV